jgi:hypothetical protein
MHQVIDDLTGLSLVLVVVYGVDSFVVSVIFIAI